MHVMTNTALTEGDGRHRLRPAASIWLAIHALPALTDQYLPFGPMISLLDRRWAAKTPAGLSSWPAALVAPGGARRVIE
jgi:hypothetical protein